MPQRRVDPLPDYEQLGFTSRLTKSLANKRGFQYSSGINFDRVQTGGSLGDKIQVGNILIDGSNERIVISDDSGMPRAYWGRRME